MVLTVAGRRGPGADQRVLSWLSVVADLLQDPLTAFPAEAVREHLAQTFDVTGVSWNWRDPDGRFGTEVSPSSLSTQGTGWDAWRTGRLFDVHPLVRWHLVTGDLAPQTASRVPTGVVPARGRQVLTRMLAVIGCEEQLSLSCHLDGVEHRTFVLARAGRDFTEEDLEVARRIQPSLTAIHRQAELLRQLAIAVPDPPAGAPRLTGRELAVLGLLSAGHSSNVIARRLSTSPRTVGKHLEHIYRKLGVQDRLNAVRVAAEAGVLPRGTLGRARAELVDRTATSRLAGARA